MAAAYSLSMSAKRKFEVTVFDSSKQAGGVATTEIAHGFPINDGVQGGSLSYKNMLMLHKLFGHEPSSIALKVSFGEGKHAWNNSDKEPTEMMKRLQPEIKRFIWLMELCFKWEKLFMLINIKQLLWVFRFSSDFTNYMVLALTALFFGTGNQTGNVPAAVVAKVFFDPDFSIYTLHPTLFLSGEAKNFFAFSELGSIYKSMQKFMENRGNVKFEFENGVDEVTRAKDHVHIVDSRGNRRKFDHVIMACDADNAKGILKDASFLESRILGNVRYYRDITVTHSDTEYMSTHFDYAPERGDQYFIRTYKHDPSLSEMGFDPTKYQPHLRNCETPLFQTIFLDEARCKSLWTIDEINSDKVLFKKWWKQFSHEVSHFLTVVPFIRFIQQPNKRTLFAGSWLMVNTHESATVSGFAAAARLGAPYPFEKENIKSGFGFKQFMDVIHGA